MPWHGSDVCNTVFEAGIGLGRKVSVGCGSNGDGWKVDKWRGEFFSAFGWPLRHLDLLGKFIQKSSKEISACTS